MADPPPSPWTLTARWLFPVASPPVERGTITLHGSQIAAITPHGARSADFDLGNVALLPGLVNAHTHLDLSGLRGRCPPSADFTAWLRAVIQHRRGLSPEQVTADIRAGLTESLTRGTTLLGDITAQGLSWPVLNSAPLRSVVFYELLGLPRARARQAGANALSWLGSHPHTVTCRVGLSPHAPYSVRGSLFRLAAAAARRHLCSIAIHLAETPAELELLEHHRGPFVPFLAELGVWDPAGLVQGPDQLLGLYTAVDPVLFIHGNYLSPQSPIPPGGTVVYCPRTHAAFGHPPHPFRQLLQAGVRIALGTDSLASNPDLDMLAEVRFLHALYPQLPGLLLLHLATLAGAEALGWADATGSLTPGKSADLVVVPLPDAEGPDPHQLLLESSAPVQAVLWCGRWIARDGVLVAPGFQF
ncbi:MAG: amidohydrolase family protein [Planctomycetes bacterium]|nr:amidohydrolase family protein [Planctomycetota bacterium]